MDFVLGDGMRKRLFAVAILSAGFAITGCGGGGKVSSASLQPRLLPGSAVPGFGLQRTLNWSDPVDLVGEGVALPQITHPSVAVKEFKDAHFRGATGEVLTSGSSFNATEVILGVAQFEGAADANRVRDWMHQEDLDQPCFSQCIFAPFPVTVSGIPSLRFVVQSSHAPPPPPGAPRGATVGPAPANYLAEFTVGPYLYWAALHADSTARARFEQGVKLYYAHAKQVT
jgi:hypothetical protein